MFGGLLVPALTPSRSAGRFPLHPVDSVGYTPKLMKASLTSARMNRHWRDNLDQLLRWLSGDLAYQSYLRHWHRHHDIVDETPLSRREFFRERTIRRWRGINRCC